MDKTVSSNGRIRGNTQRRRFESCTIPFSFFREEFTFSYEGRVKYMLNLKHFTVGREEYVILKKDTLEDVLHTAIVLTSMLDQNYRLLKNGYGDPNFDVSNVTVEDEILFWSKHCVHSRDIVDRILESL